MFASTSRTMFMMAGAACASIAAAATPSLSESSEPRKKIVVVGGGTAGLTVAAQLMKKTQGSLDVILIEPRTVHYYQPMWTMIGGHLGFTSTDSARPMKDLVPKNIQWLQSSVDKFLPEKDTVILKSGESLTYDSLVVAAGIKNDLDRIKGLREALEDPSSPVGSIYDAKFAEKTDRMLSKIKKGDVLFTQPPNPIKCGGGKHSFLSLVCSVFVYLSSVRVLNALAIARSLALYLALALALPLHSPTEGDVAMGVSFPANEHQARRECQLLHLSRRHVSGREVRQCAQENV